MAVIHMLHLAQGSPLCVHHGGLQVDGSHPQVALCPRQGLYVLLGGPQLDGNHPDPHARDR
eukprot:3477083-Alexandrium_andersonii.AAC.1